VAFGITRIELKAWQAAVAKGEIAFLTHYWLDPRFPDAKTVTKVGCADLDKLAAWCRANGLPPNHIHARSEYPHFDLLGRKQAEVLAKEGLFEQMERFRIPWRE
jgi:hypothetical protein